MPKQKEFVQLDDQNVFIGVVTVDEHPFKKGEYLVPPNALEIPTPKTLPRKLGDHPISYVWGRGTWKSTIDYRNTPLYFIPHGEPVKRGDIPLGKTPKDLMATTLAPAEFEKWDAKKNRWAIPIEHWVSVKKKVIADLKNSLLTQGYKSELFKDVLFSCSPEAEMKNTNLLNNADVYFVDGVMENFKAKSDYLSITYDQLTVISKEISVFIKRCFDAEFIHLRAVGSAKTVEELNEYDVSLYWPMPYTKKGI